MGNLIINIMILGWFFQWRGWFRFSVSHSDFHRTHGFPDGLTCIYRFFKYQRPSRSYPMQVISKEIYDLFVEEVTYVREEIQKEIDRMERKGHRNLGKKGCVRRLDEVLWNTYQRAIEWGC